MAITLDDSPAEVNLIITQGDDWTQSFQIGATPTADDADLADPDLVTRYDLTGWTGQAQVRRKPADQSEDVIVEMTVTIDDQTDTPGQFTCSMTAAQTLLLPKKVAVWDLELVDPGGFKKTEMAGSVTAGREVTREA